MPAFRRHNDITIVRVNCSGPGAGKIYRFFLKKDGEILADGASLSEAELVEYIERENPGGRPGLSQTTKQGFTNEK